MSRELRTAKMKKSSGGIKKSFTNKKFKSGAYSSFITTEPKPYALPDFV